MPGNSLKVSCHTLEEGKEKVLPGGVGPVGWSVLQVRLLLWVGGGITSSFYPPAGLVPFLVTWRRQTSHRQVWPTPKLPTFNSHSQFHSTVISLLNSPLIYINLPLLKCQY